MKKGSLMSKNSLVFLFLLFIGSETIFAQSQKKAPPKSNFCESASQKMAQKKFQEAIVEFDKCLKDEKDNFLAYIERGKAKSELKKYPEALADFSKALQLNKDYFQAAVLMAQANENLKKYKEAMDNYSLALKINPQNSESFVGRGLLYEQDNKLDLALKDFETVIAKNNGNYKAFWGKGKVLEKQKKSAEAIAEFHKAINIQKNDPQVFYSRAKSYASSNKHKEAIVDYLKTIELKYQEEEVYINLSKSCLTIGDADNLIKAFAYLTDYKKTKNPEIYFIRGQAFFVKNDWGAAAKDYGKAITLNPKYDAAYVERGKCYYLMGDKKYQLSWADFKKASELNSKNEEGFFGYGKLSFHLNKFQEGIDALTKAIAMNNSGESFYIRSKCYYKLNKTKECCADLKKASDLGVKDADKDATSVCK